MNLNDFKVGQVCRLKTYFDEFYEVCRITAVIPDDEDGEDRIEFDYVNDDAEGFFVFLYEFNNGDAKIIIDDERQLDLFCRWRG